MKSKYTKKNVKHAIRRSVIIAVVLCIVIWLINIAPNYIKESTSDKATLIINNKNVTENLKSDIIIKDDIVYLSTDDVKNFFDEYLIQTDTQIITVSNTKTVSIPKNNEQITVNGSSRDLDNKIIFENDKYYLPMNNFSDIYNYELKYSKDTNTIMIDSLSKRFVQAVAKGNLFVKYKATGFSKTVANVKRGEKLTLVQDFENSSDIMVDGWYKVRTSDGIMGYVKKNDLISEEVVRDNLEDNKIEGKVSIAWDYYTQYNSAPKYTGKINGINVVSPSFFELRTNGNIMTNDLNAKDYVEWAKKSGYQVWPTLSNSMLNNLDEVSKQLSTFESRANLIDKIVTAVVNTNVDGIVIDFENMYKNDKDNYSRFIIELSPRLNEIGRKLCVEVTEPDGSDNWSLCYDRHVIGSVADYIIFIGYDQHTASSKVAGTVAGADWIELNIKKFLGQEEINKDKIILAMPFYMRLWKENNGTVTSTVVNMNNIAIPAGAEKKWDEATKQNYIEYKQNNSTYKMWIEDADSISAKIDLINKYELAGAGFWEIGRENADIWQIASSKLGIN